MGCHESLATSCDFQHSRQQQPSVVAVGLEDGYYHMWDTRMEGPVKSVKGNRKERYSQVKVKVHNSLDLP